MARGCKTLAFLACTLVCLLPRVSDADINVYTETNLAASNGGLAGFNLAAGNPPIAITFDSIATGTDVTGATIAGVTFSSPLSGAPLLVVDGNATFTPSGFTSTPNLALNKLFPTSGQNVLSPGGLELGPGPNNPLENDDLQLVFNQPVNAFGFDHLSQSADGFGFTSIQVFSPSDSLLFSGSIPISNLDPGFGGDRGGDDFWGVVASGGDLVGRIVVSEGDGNAAFPDSNIGFDTFRFTPVPEPSSLLAISLIAAMAVARRRHKPRQSGVDTRGH